MSPLMKKESGEIYLYRVMGDGKLDRYLLSDGGVDHWVSQAANYYGGVFSKEIIKKELNRGRRIRWGNDVPMIRKLMRTENESLKLEMENSRGKVIRTFGNFEVKPDGSIVRRVVK